MRLKIAYALFQELKLLDTIPGINMRTAEDVEDIIAEPAGYESDWAIKPQQDES